MLTINKKPSNWTEEEVVDLLNDKVKMGTAIDEEKMLVRINEVTGSDFTSYTEAKEAFDVALSNTTTPINDDVNDSTGIIDETIGDVYFTATKDDPVELNIPEEQGDSGNTEANNTDSTTPDVNDTNTTEPQQQTPSVSKNLIEDIVEENLTEYVNKMTPGYSHAQGEGARLQSKLWQTIQTVLRTDGPQFTKLFSLLLKTVYKNRDTVFNEYNIYRYFETVNIPGNERRNFERIINLLLVTNNPALRAESLKQVDLDATLQGFNNTEIHQKVVGFYQNI